MVIYRCGVYCEVCSFYGCLLLKDLMCAHLRKKYATCLCTPRWIYSFWTTVFSITQHWVYAARKYFYGFLTIKTSKYIETKILSGPFLLVFSLCDSNVMLVFFGVLWSLKFVLIVDSCIK